MDAAAYDAFLESDRAERMSPSSRELEDQASLRRRHIGPREAEIAAMLARRRRGLAGRADRAHVPAAIRTGRGRSPCRRRDARPRRWPPCARMAAQQPRRSPR